MASAMAGAARRIVPRQLVEDCSKRLMKAQDSKAVRLAVDSFWIAR